MFKLFIVPDDRNVVSPVVPVRWCLDETILPSIKLDTNEELFVLISVLPKNDEPCGSNERRITRPAKEVQVFLTFTKPGDHYIAGVLLRGRREEMYASKGALIRSNVMGGNLYNYYHGAAVSGRWDCPVWEKVYDEDSQDLRCVPCKWLDYAVCDPAYFELNIPKECFAPEPRKWEKWWVNYLFNGQMPIDQCAFRRRRILAYTLQPIMFLLWFLVGIPSRWVMAGTTVLAGFWDIEWRALVHPFALPFTSIWDSITPAHNVYLVATRWLHRRVKVLFVKLAPKLPAKEQRRLEMEVRQEEERRLQEEKRRHLDSYGILSCSLKQTPATRLVSFPQKVHLIYAEIKQAVCKPFAK